MKAFLERSGDAPISVFLDFCTKKKNYLARWEAFRPHILRARKIELHDAPLGGSSLNMDVADIVSEIIDNIPQCVEVIDITLPKLSSEFDVRWTAPADLSLPHLRHVSMRYIPYSRHSKAFAGLRTLVLECDSKSPMKPDLNMLFDAIKARPLLNTLELSLHMRKITLPSGNPSRPPVPMTHLRQVTLATSFTAISGAFLSRFALPVATRVEIDDMPGSRQEAMEVGDTLPKLFGRIDIPIVRLYVVVDSADWEGALERIMVAGYTQPSEEIDPEILGSEVDKATGILNNGPPYLTEFDCVPRPGMGARWWTQTFEKMENLRFLTLRSKVFRDIIEALSSSIIDSLFHTTTTASGVEEESCRPLLPLLETLSLLRVKSKDAGFKRRMNFGNQERRTSEPSHDIYGVSESFSSLVEYIQKRNDRNLGLESLTLPTLKLPPLDHVMDQVAVLEDIVEIVDGRYMDPCRYLPGWSLGAEEGKMVFQTRWRSIPHLTKKTTKVKNDGSSLDGQKIKHFPTRFHACGYSIKELRPNELFGKFGDVCAIHENSNYFTSTKHTVEINHYNVYVRT